MGSAEAQSHKRSWLSKQIATHVTQLLHGGSGVLESTKLSAVIFDGSLSQLEHLTKKEITMLKTTNSMSVTQGYYSSDSTIGDAIAATGIFNKSAYSECVGLNEKLEKLFRIEDNIVVHYEKVG